MDSREREEFCESLRERESNMALRKLAVRYVVDRGMDEEVVANLLDRRVDWVRVWVSRYREGEPREILPARLPWSRRGGMARPNGSVSVRRPQAAPAYWHVLAWSPAGRTVQHRKFSSPPSGSSTSMAM